MKMSIDPKTIIRLAGSLKNRATRRMKLSWVKRKKS